MKARIISSLLVLCMLIALSACGGQKQQNESTGTTTAAVENSTTAAPVQDEKMLPYKGEKVTISLLGWESYKDVDPNTEFGKYFQEQMGNIKLEIEIPTSDSQTKADLYLASGDMPDIMIYRQPDKFIRNYGDGSRSVNLLDYAKYMPQYNERRKTFPHLSWYDVNGKTFIYFPCWYDSTSEMWYQNQDVADKYSLKAPANFDEMMQNMETVHKADPGINGMFFYTWGFEYNFQAFSSLFGSKGIKPSDVVWDDNQNKWVFALTAYNDIYKNATQAMADAYSKGLLNKDFINMGDQWSTQRNNGQWLYDFSYPFTSAEVTGVLKAKPVYINPPAASGVKPSVRTDYQSDITMWGFLISKDSKNPELCAGILELIASKELAEKYYWGWEGETFTKDANGKKAFTDAYLKLNPEEVQAQFGMTVPYAFMALFSMFHAGDAIAAGWCDESKKGTAIAAQKLKSGEYETYYYANVPELSDEANDKVGKDLTSIKTYVNETLTAFVLGSKKMSEWDGFITGVTKYGDINYIVDQYNAAKQKPDRPLQTERDYLVP